MLKKIASKYFQRFPHLDFTIAEKLNPQTNIIVVIPSLNEKHLLETLESLAKCFLPKFPVAVLVVINASRNANPKIIQQNIKTHEALLAWKKLQKPHFQLFSILNQDLSPKHAGAGLARKIGMDEALKLFQEIDKDGILVCLDADCLVEKNYFQAIESQFQNKVKGANIYYEHDFKRLKNEVLKQGIIHYELHLRYYVQALRWANYPFAFHTVGSSMAVRASVYALQGGMNKRKAGEDFYFLHKIIPLGNFIEINETCIYPSARVSDRVPFGTGKAQQNWVKNQKNSFETYNFNIFQDLQIIFNQIDTFYTSSKIQLPDSVLAFLESQDFSQALHRIQKHSNNLETFRKHFWQWWDGFRVMKFIHFSRDNFYPNEKLENACNKLLKIQNQEMLSNLVLLLKKYRDLDKK